MKRFLKEKKTSILFVVSILFSFTLITIYFMSKRTFNMDESFSFALANFFEAPIPGWIIYDTNTEVSKELMNGYTVTANAFNYKAVSYNMAHDVHPPLYAWILHTISSVFKGRFTIWFSYLLNAPLFLINCFLLMKIVKEETKSDLYMVLINLLYSLNSVFLYHFQLIRMYQLLSTITLLFLYVVLMIIKNKGKPIVNYLLLFATTIIGGLSHYYFYIALGCISLCALVYLVINKRFKDLLWSFLSCASATLLNIFVIFDATIDQFGFSHGASSLEKLKSFLINIDFMKEYINQSYGGTTIFIIMLILLIVSIVMSIIKKNHKFDIVLLLLVSYFINYLFVSNLATFVNERYMMAMEVIGLLALFLGLCYLIEDKRVVAILSCGIILLNLDFSWVSRLNTTKSWDVAKWHQWDKAFVLSSNEHDNYNQINAYLWIDLRWYGGVYTSSVSGDISNVLMGDEFVLYIDKDLDQNQALKKIKNELCGGQDYKYIEKVDAYTSKYNMYILHG